MNFFPMFRGGRTGTRRLLASTFLALAGCGGSGAIVVFDLTTYAVAAPHHDWLKVLYVLGAVVSIGVGSAFYLTCNLGPGPRDGLMTGLHNRLNVSIVYIRLSIEAVVLTIGWLMGGTVGVATAFFATTIGFSIGASLNVMERVLKWRTA